MKNWLYLIFFTINACAPPIANNENSPQSPTLSFTKLEITNLIMVTKSMLDGRLESTGELAEGASTLAFEDGFMWAFGESSPQNVHGHQTKYSWYIGSKGQVRLTSLPIDGESEIKCDLWKTKVHAREFTKDGLPEKISTRFHCNYFPEGKHVLQEFHLPLPLFPYMMAGNTTTHSASPETTKSYYQPDHKIKRQDPMKPYQDEFLYDPYMGGNYQHSITVNFTDMNRTETEEKPRTIGMRRLFLFEHLAPKHGTILDFSYTPVVFTPKGENGYLHQKILRFELQTIYRLKNLTYNSKQGNYVDRPDQIARSRFGNSLPLKNALVFK